MAYPTPEQLLNDALAAQRRGSVGDAKRLYASVLKIDPANASAYGNLAIIAAQEAIFRARSSFFEAESRFVPAMP